MHPVRNLPDHVLEHGVPLLWSQTGVGQVKLLNLTLSELEIFLCRFTVAENQSRFESSACVLHFLPPFQQLLVGFVPTLQTLCFH
jgi:hypothetical protein